MIDKVARRNTISAGCFHVPLETGRYCGPFTAITLKAGVGHALDRDWLKQAFYFIDVILLKI